MYDMALKGLIKCFEKYIKRFLFTKIWLFKTKGVVRLT